FVRGPVPDDSSLSATPRRVPELATMHRYPLDAQQPRRVPGGGTQRTVTVDEFPISTTMAGSVIELQPGALRELHWHPNARNTPISTSAARQKWACFLPREMLSSSSSKPATSAMPPWGRVTTSRTLAQRSAAS